MPPEEDVSQSASSTDAAVAQAGAGTVTPESGADRPVENAVAEFNRKFAKLERALENLSTLVVSNRPAEPPRAQAETITDEDLWRLAQQGDRNAYDVYMRRRAAEATRSEMQGERQARLVDSQLATLAQKYPVLNDTDHPLTQTVQKAYRLLTDQGYQAGKWTLLEAIKLAIADRPDLIAELHNQGAVVRDAARRSATQVAQAGQTGATHREGGGPSPKPKPVSAEKAALAKRMGISDPAKSEARFLERQAAGQSSLGAVASFVREEEM